MKNGHGHPPVFGSRINGRNISAGFTEVLDAGDGGKANGKAVDAVADVCLAAIRPGNVAGKVIVCRTAAAAVAPEAEAPVLLIAFHLAVGAGNLVPLIHRPLEIRRQNPVVVIMHAHAVGIIHTHLHRVEGVDAITHEPFLLADRRERHRLAVVIVPKQIRPMRAHIAEWIAVLHPLECARGNFQRLFQHRETVNWITDLFRNIIAHTQVIRIVPLVHIHADDQAFRLGGGNNLVRLVHVQAHRLLGDHVRAIGQRRQNYRRVQMIRRSHGHHIEIREIPQHILPRRFAVIRLRLAPSPFLVICSRLCRTRLRTRRHRN